MPFNTRISPAGGAGGGGGDEIHVDEQQAAGVTSGQFASGAWQTRALNTVVQNDISGASLAANQITLPAGTYVAEWDAQAFGVDRNQSRLQNVTDATTVAPGLSMFSSSTNGSPVVSSGRVQFTIVDTKVFEVQHRCATTSGGTQGFGVEANLGLAEIYAQVVVRKVGG